MLAVALGLTGMIGFAGSAGAAFPSPDGPSPVAPGISVSVSQVAGLTPGQVITYQVSANSAVTTQQINGDVEVHLCKTGFTANNWRLNPGTFSYSDSSGSRCPDETGFRPTATPIKLSPATATYAKTTSHNSAATTGPQTWTVGTGSASWVTGGGSLGGAAGAPGFNSPEPHLTCDFTHPCDMVFRVNLSGSPSVAWFVQELHFAAPPAPPGTPANLSASGADGSVLLTWDKDTTASPAVTDYNASWVPHDSTAVGQPCEGATPGSINGIDQPSGPGPVSQLVSSLVNGCTYDFSLVSVNAQGASAVAATASAMPEALVQVIYQDISVTRAEGELVLTQECAGSDIYPDTDTPPDPGPVGDVTDVVYPTFCTVDLGTATLVKTGAGAGQYFKAEGAIEEVTVVDTRDTDDGWTVSGVLTSDFTSTTDHFSAKNLGWVPADPDVTDPIVANDTDAAYAQTATKGGVRVPISEGLKGFPTTTYKLAEAASGAGLGIARMNAGLTVMIPIYKEAGTYTARLQITVI